MDYKDAPMLERLLIDNVINAWLRCQWTEIRLADIAGEVTYREVEFWEKRLSLSQARYLRACETLTRVRKLARNTPALQVNIAAEGGQQVNVSGELNVKKGEGENHETSNGQ
jgi:hypothetical protein